MDWKELKQQADDWWNEVGYSYYLAQQNIERRKQCQNLQKDL